MVWSNPLSLEFLNQWAKQIGLNVEGFRKERILASILSRKQMLKVIFLSAFRNIFTNMESTSLKRVSL